jgi:5-dehydro-2-deoxygluconokinase
VAVAAARLGHRSAVVTAVGDDGFGDYARGALDGFGVDTTFVGTHAHYRTPLAIASMDPPDDPKLLFYREPSAPDEEIALEERHLEAARDVEIFWVTGSCLAGRDTGPTARAMLEARGRKRHTVLDLDYRPTFWPSEEAASREIGGAIGAVTVAVGNRRECEVAVGTGDPDAAADALLERGVELAVVKQGPKGVLAATRDERVEVPPFPVDVVNGLGAGDAFGGALCHGLLSGWDLRRVLEFANVAGAIVASKLECSTAMPTTAEVDERLATSLSSAPVAPVAPVASVAEEAR